MKIKTFSQSNILQDVELAENLIYFLQRKRTFLCLNKCLNLMKNMSFLIWINCPLVWITAKNGMHFKFTRHAKYIGYKGMLITTAKGKRIY